MISKFKRWILSLRGKFILAASVCIIAFTAIGSYIILSREEKLYMQDMTNQCRIIAEISRVTLTNVMVFNELGMMDDQDLTDYLDYFIMSLMEQDKRMKYVVVFDKDGSPLARSGVPEDKAHTDEALLKAAASLDETEIVDAKFQKDHIHRITTPLNIGTKRWGGIQIGLSMEDVHRSINALKKEITFLTVLFSALSLTIIGIGSKVLAKPVIRLSNVMDNIKTYGDLETVGTNHELPLLKERSDEIGELQKSFLWMLQRLREADKEHKKTLEVLSQTEKMVSVGRLASGVAHEINNPLSGITLCFRNLIEADVDSRTREKLILAVNDSLQKIENIVKQLLDFSRVTVTEKTTVNLNNLINRLLVLFNYPASKKNVKIVNYLSDDIPEILIDENKMSQVFTNIIINALQAMDGGGTLTIKTERVNGFCVVSIEDTGTGIPADVLPNIFDPFFTTKRIGEGTGLGLSVSKGIVELHGGIIEVESQIGAGTKFRIKLPIT